MEVQSFREEYTCLPGSNISMMSCSTSYGKANFLLHHAQSCLHQEQDPNTTALEESFKIWNQRAIQEVQCKWKITLIETTLQFFLYIKTTLQFQKKLHTRIKRIRVVIPQKMQRRDELSFIAQAQVIEKKKKKTVYSAFSKDIATNYLVIR